MMAASSQTRKTAPALTGPGTSAPAGSLSRSFAGQRFVLLGPVGECRLGRDSGPGARTGRNWRRSSRALVGGPDFVEAVLPPFDAQQENVGFSWRVAFRLSRRCLDNLKWRGANL